MQEKYLAIMKSIANLKDDLVLVLKGSEIVLANRAFSTFFGVNSLEEYHENFGDFLDNFVPHPSYFNKEKIQDNDSWTDSILKLPEIDRVVSMLSQDYEPYAFSVSVDTTIDGFYVINLVDITQTLIKRIMIENNATLDKQSAAYAKRYFLQVMKSFEDAAIFNEKIIAVNLIELEHDEDLEDEKIAQFVHDFKTFIRDDDMLVKWGKSSFILVYLVDDTSKVQRVTQKLQNIRTVPIHISSAVQKEQEPISKIIEKLEK